MKTEYIYKWTANEDYNIPNNNYGEETESVVCEDPYNFSDWLSDNGITYDYDIEGDTYYVTDEDGNRTGEAYWIVDVVTDTDKELSW